MMSTKLKEQVKNSKNKDERINHIALPHSKFAFCGAERKTGGPYPDGKVCTDCLLKLGDRPVKINGKLVYLNN